MKGQTKLLKHVYNRYIAKERVPAFLIPNKNIKTLLTPPEFYNTIIEGIKSSKYRILISSLYIGTGQLERQLVDTLIDSSNKNPKLIVKILVDKNRGLLLPSLFPPPPPELAADATAFCLFFL